MPTFLMSPPRHDWGIRGRHNFKSRQSISAKASDARREWIALADAITHAGGEVVVCPPHPRRNLTGMMYTAEAGELWRDAEGRWRWILPTMAAPHRVDEADWIGGFWAGFGATIESITPLWEAQGDAIRLTPSKIVHTYGVGEDARTEAQAYREVATRLSDAHLHLSFRASPWFHGNTFMGAYHGVDRSICFVCEEALRDPQGWEKLASFAAPEVELVPITRAESEAYITNALQVGETVLATTGAPARCVALLEDLGLCIHRLDLPILFGSGGGAPVCLTNRLWALETCDDPLSFPDAVVWREGSSLHDFLGE